MGLWPLYCHKNYYYYYYYYCEPGFIAIAALTGPDNGYAIITYPPKNTYGRWISSNLLGINF